MPKSSHHHTWRDKDHLYGPTPQELAFGNDTSNLTKPYRMDSSRSELSLLCVPRWMFRALSRRKRNQGFLANKAVPSWFERVSTCSLLDNAFRRNVFLVRMPIWSSYQWYQMQIARQSWGQYQIRFARCNIYYLFHQNDVFLFPAGWQHVWVVAWAHSQFYGTWRWRWRSHDSAILFHCRLFVFSASSNPLLVNFIFDRSECSWCRINPAASLFQLK